MCALAAHILTTTHWCSYATICGVVISTTTVIAEIVLRDVKRLPTTEWVIWRCVFIPLFSITAPATTIEGAAWKMFPEAIAYHYTEKSAAQASYDATQQPDYRNVA